MYDDGDTIDPGVAQAFCGMGLISILDVFEFDTLWFAFALEGRRKTR